LLIESSEKGAAFLVRRVGGDWREVYGLTPGHVTTIGRSSTNRIIVDDEICSRNQCEVFQAGNSWVLRDLRSRNGTHVDGRQVSGDWSLEVGQIIQIGSFALGFIHDLTELPDGLIADRETVTTEFKIGDGGLSDQIEILHRKGKSVIASEDSANRYSSELSKLFRLGLELGTAETPAELSDVVLMSLSRETVADICAILLLPAKPDQEPQPSGLQVVAYRAENDLPYQRVSDNLSQTVLTSREAILGNNVESDATLSVFDSLGKMKAMSVICAPIRSGDKLLGLVHLYSTNPDNSLDIDDLEYVVAVSDQFGVALDKIHQREVLATGLEKVRGTARMMRKQLELTSQLIGVSEIMNELRATIGLIAKSDATALVRGESGVGKELVARAIHYQSNRSDGPLVCMNCAALSESLLESELFGHEKGAFTGAFERKMGRFEQSDGGTLFLDEVGEMSPSIQAKFLRVLEGHPFERVGGRQSLKVDVRVVAATNRNLESAIEDGSFRKDLYFRLHVAEIRVPPLRQHIEDVEVLANHFLEKFAKKSGSNIAGFTQGAMDALTNYHWPGNVRELQNTIERTVIMCANEVVCESDIRLSSLEQQLAVPACATAPVASIGYRSVSIADLEKEHILATLEHLDWNKSQAAQILGIERSTLDRKLKRYHVTRPDRAG
jgi:two-component system response regulator HydG